MSSQAREYIAQARQLSSTGCFSKAVDLYLMAFVKNSQLKELFEPEFRATIIKLNEVLAAANKMEDIFANFSRSIKIFPGNMYLLNEVGKYLYKFGYYEEAWTQFLKALAVDASYVNAEKNLNSLKNLMVERWHFRMLNDKVRNDGYRAAIHEKIEPYVTSVLDMGTGTGLLSMYAAENNPMAITACDGSDIMTSLADCILEDNRLLFSVVVLNKMSTSMSCKDIGVKRSLLVTELFDAGLFGEHILQSLSHAWENLLSQNAYVIPQGAAFFVMGVHSDLLNAKYQLCSKTKNLLNINNLQVHILTCDETYDSDDIHLYKDIEYMTEPQLIVEVNFMDPHDIQDKLVTIEPYLVELKAIKNGQINIFVGWFNLYLTSNVTLTTDPRVKTRANAWQQAVFFDNIPRNVQENKTFSVNFLINSGKITMQSNSSSNIMRVSPEMIRFLNDTDYLKMIKNCIGMAFVYLGQIAHISDIKIVDICPFPFFGLYMLQRGIKNLICYAKTDNDKRFIEEVFRVNNIELNRVTILVGDDLSEESFQEEKFHAIFCNIFDLCGDLDMHYKEIAQFLKNAHLTRGGLFMPADITLIAQIVSSKWLDVNNRVYDKNLGYKVAMHINKYQVSQNFCIDYTRLEYTPISDPVALGNCYNLSSNVFNVPVQNDGDANAVICWYNIELMESLGDITTKRAYSFVDGIAFLANPIITMMKGETANIITCVDSDGSFKLVIDVENT